MCLIPAKSPQEKLGRVTSWSEPAGFSCCFIWYTLQVARDLSCCPKVSRDLDGNLRIFIILFLGRAALVLLVYVRDLVMGVGWLRRA